VTPQEWVRRALAARHEQGLPDRVTDPAALGRIARLFARSPTPDRLPHPAGIEGPAAAGSGGEDLDPLDQVGQ